MPAITAQRDPVLADTPLPPLSDRVPRASLLTRVAMHVALRVLIWSTRPVSLSTARAFSLPKVMICAT